MEVVLNPVRNSLSRQVNHWLQAAKRLSALEHLASGNAWQGLDPVISTTLRKSLQTSVDALMTQSMELVRKLESSGDPDTLRNVRRGLNLLRDRYLKAEETIHFYTEAINSRTTPNVAALLRACDILCVRSMEELLKPLGKQTPYVITYVEKGIGASILKAGLRLWDGNMSSLAAIKITQHNLFRPTAIIHETGHQVAHMLNWTDELANGFIRGMQQHPQQVGQAFASWASEIAADAFAFVHTGYASVAALHDVLSGAPQNVFAYHAHDPHPICYLRVLMSTEMCRQHYGEGPWDDLERSFRNDYDINQINYPWTSLIQECEKAMPDAVKMILNAPYNAFRQKSLAEMIPPSRVSPSALEKLEQQAGAALYTSHAWIWKECIRILALVGYKIGIGEGDLTSYYKQQEDWMIKLGFSVQMN